MAPTPDDDPTRPWVGTGTPWSTSADDAARDAVELQNTIRRRESEKRGRRRDDSVGSFLRELPLLLLIAFGLAFLMRTFVVQVFYIPSESMVPTLQVDDRIVVEKISYRFGGPNRGDVVVFAGDSPFPEAPQSTAQRVVRGVGQFLGVVPVDARDLVKRVIGLPGDRVEITDGQVTVNGESLDEPYAELDEDDGLFTVPAGAVFVMGDNRANSADSRSQLGYVGIDDIVGRAVVTIWPLDRTGSVTGADHSDVPEPSGTEGTEADTPAA